jgi:hypothetical protein
VPSLFDDFERTNPAPAKHSEDSFSFLNRAAGSFWANVRDELERWFDGYPAAHEADLRQRFRSRRPDQHWGAWWELYLFRVLTALGFEVDVHPEIAGSPAHPDFRIRREGTLYLEATTVFSGIVDEGRHAQREGWILDALNEGKSDNFFVWVHMDEVGMERPTVREVVGPVEEWLNGLDPDVIEASRNAGGALPARIFPFRDWRVRLEALPKRPEGRGKHAHRLVGVGPMSIGFVNDREMIGKALDRKRRRHSKVDAPLILAVLGMSPALDQEDVGQALFGSEAMEIDTGQLIRKPDGFWRGARGASATGVSAVLIGSDIQPWFALRTWPRLWMNPWATQPLATDLPFPRASVQAERLVFSEATQPPHEVLGLPAGWPGDPSVVFDDSGS